MPQATVLTRHLGFGLLMCIFVWMLLLIMDTIVKNYEIVTNDLWKMYHNIRDIDIQYEI